ncbi:hypothetical protein J2Y41_001312 [Arthrobacter sp. 1088]|uniref:hypothetical protein n=1 Tax=Arthrobacter sp. 1088 TaxID=2817768 RepID=UPI002863F8C2|nr:hypothetical protein [Arthrobacter sp. 1088]MDR6685757.1 hypothetical protein [Arthrobacter sp. 1088]
MTDLAFEARVALKVALLKPEDVATLRALVEGLPAVINQAGGHASSPATFAFLGKLERYMRETMSLGNMPKISSEEWVVLRREPAPNAALVLRGLSAITQTTLSIVPISSEAMNFLGSLLKRLQNIVNSIHAPRHTNDFGWQWNDFDAGWASGLTNSEYDLSSVLRAVARPHGDWLPPLNPIGSGILPPFITYWFSLSAVVLGHLAWSDPVRGVTTWVNLGMPEDGAVLTAVRRLFGSDSAALILNHNLSGMAELMGGSQGLPSKHDLLYELRQTFVGDAAVDPRVQENDSWAAMLLGGTDSLHLRLHLEQMLVHPRPQCPNITYAREAGSKIPAHLHLPSSYGWYEALTRAAVGLPERADGRSWRVDVTTEDVGFIGRFRMSRVTGRWFSGKHSSHMLGN